MNSSTKPSRATLRRMAQVMDAYALTDARHSSRREQLLNELAGLTGDGGNPVRTARKILRQHRRPRDVRAMASEAARETGPRLAAARKPDAKRVTHVISTPVETDRSRH